MDSPEELHPLKDALERAKQRVDQSTGIREALEAEVSLLNRVYYSGKAQWSRLLLLLKLFVADCIFNIGVAAGANPC